MENNYFCSSCKKSKFYHLQTWFDELSQSLWFSWRLSPKIENRIEVLIANILVKLKLAEWVKDFTLADTQLRSWLFTEEIKKRGGEVWALKSVSGLTNHFKIKLNGKTVQFAGLPLAEFENKYSDKLVNDKILAKDHCLKAGFPTPAGKNFWFWQKKKALTFSQNLDYPLVVKPRSGSVSQHVTTNIKNEDELKRAINYSLTYSPCFIVEKFINAPVIRITVIDFDFVAAVKQVPANVIGDGVSTINQLIDQKNQEPIRNMPHQEKYPLSQIIKPEDLGDRAPDSGEVIILQTDPFLKLGGDLVEVTSEIHPDNKELFRSLAKHFDIRLVGIDCLITDISQSWKNQTCAILELNSLPCIDLHHYPYKGKPTDPAKALADMFIKYYL